MQELSRCLRESQGLSYMFIAAQKYGFRPFPRTIPEALFNELLQVVHEKYDRDLITAWFKLDQNGTFSEALRSNYEFDGPLSFAGTEGNTSGCFFVLQSQEKLGEGEEWWPIFQNIQRVLRGAARTKYPNNTSLEALRDPENTHFSQRFFISVTEEVTPALYYLLTS